MTVSYETIPLWRQVVDQGAITPRILNHPYPGSGTKEDPYTISWLPNDPRDPRCFDSRKKVAITVVSSLATVAAAVCPSAFAGATKPITQDLNVTTGIATLGMTLFVFGCAVGSVFWGPLSEVIGRQWPSMLSFGSMTLFLAGSAAIPSIHGLLILRFLCGLSGSSPLVNSGFVINDMFTQQHRGLALTLFAAAPFLGAVIALIATGFLGQSAGWRWICGLLAMMSGVIWVVTSCFVPETYAPILLRRRAERLSSITGKVYRSRLDIEAKEKETLSPARALWALVLRPWMLFFQEPIVFCLTVYLSLLYGMLFFFSAAFRVIYQEGRGWSQGVTGLAYVGILVGMILGALAPFPENARYRRVARRSGGFPPPEARLPLVMFASLCIPIGLFWFAWTNSPSTHWSVGIIAGAPLGFGVVVVYLGVVNYLLDSYTVFAPAAPVGIVVLRSLFGGAFSLVTPKMYESLGIHWASSVPAFLTVACTPLPFIFYRYGRRIRERSKYAAQAQRYADKMQQAAAKM